jgi:hypothetical protein
MRALAILPLLVAAPALAEDSFETAAAGAQRIARIESVVWAFTAPCDTGDDTQQRQCRKVRDSRAAELAGATLLVDADREAFEVGAWSAQKKSVALKLSACIRCAGVEIDGKTYFVVASKAGNPAPTLSGGKLEVGRLHDNARQFPDETTAKAYAASLASARVQLLVKVPPKPVTTVDGKPVLALDFVGHRVFTPCSGTVVFASPQSGSLEPDKKQCVAGAEVDEVTPAMVNDAMKPVVKAANECFARFMVSGTAKLKVSIGSDGGVLAYEQQGDFVSTPTGKCIDAAMSAAAFPRSTKPKTTFSYPIHLK